MSGGLKRFLATPQVWETQLSQVLNTVEIFQPRADQSALRADQVNAGWGNGKPKGLRRYAVLSCP
jgi:hypothetical protein